MKDFLCKAHSADLSINYSDWIWSRKLNGFSMLWDGGISTGKALGQILWGKERANESRYTKCTGLWTSDGHIVHAPEWWYKDFPKFIPLQGECWCNDDKTIASVCNCKPSNSFTDMRWNVLEFIVYNYKPYSLFAGQSFGLPEEIEQNILFKIHFENVNYLKRLNNLVDVFEEYSLPIFSTKKEIDLSSSNLHLIDFNLIHKNLDLGELLKEKTTGEDSWEGIMLARPDALYTCGRSYDLLKLKPEYDIEVEIIGYRNGEKKYTGKMGSLNVKLTWDEKVLSFHGGNSSFIGKTIFFSVGGGFNDLEREWDFVHEKFAIGKKINIKFNEVGYCGSIPSARWSGENE